jgi:hypothetical protein
MADQVLVVTARGDVYAQYEEFPLAGGEKVKCLVLQPENGDPPVRVAADSPEADKLRERHPELKQLDDAGEQHAEAEPESGGDGG